MKLKSVLLTVFFLLGLCLPGKALRAAPALPVPITFLGMLQDGKASEALNDTVVQRLRRLGESVESQAWTLSLEEKTCMDRKCVETTAWRHGALRLLQGRVSKPMPKSKGDAVRVEMFFVPAPDQAVRWQVALCAACNERQLTALVASLAGRILDEVAGRWSPLRVPEFDVPMDDRPVGKAASDDAARAGSSDLQAVADRLRAGLDQLSGQVQRMSTQLEKATTKAEQLANRRESPGAEAPLRKSLPGSSRDEPLIAKVEPSAYKAEPGAAKAEQNIGKAEQSAARAEQLVTRVEQAFEKANQVLTALARVATQIETFGPAKIELPPPATFEVSDVIYESPLTLTPADIISLTDCPDAKWDATEKFLAVKTGGSRDKCEIHFEGNLPWNPAGFLNSVVELRINSRAVDAADTTKLTIKYLPASGVALASYELPALGKTPGLVSAVRGHHLPISTAGPAIAKVCVTLELARAASAAGEVEVHLGKISLTASSRLPGGK